MIEQLDKFEIIRRYKKGEAKKSIARETGYNIKTVRRYCNEYDELIDSHNAGLVSDEDFQEMVLSKPTYNSHNRKTVKYTDEIDKALDEILLSELRKDQLLGNHKQKLTVVQIHKKLLEAGYDIGKTTISNKIRVKKDKAKECFIRQEYDYGARMEFDFGEVKLLINGKLSKFYIAVISSPASAFRWAYLYKNQKKDVFMNAHVRFFEMARGVYREVVYDNMKNVVTRFLGKNEKELNQDLLNLSHYYGFDINVTNAFSGNEKGHVEGSVKIIRREVYGSKFEFNSFEEAEEFLQHELIALNKEARFEEEKKFLLPYKPKLDLASIIQVSVDKYGFVRIQNNRYSVPDYLAQRKITAKIYYNKIIFYSNNHYVCEHKKKDGRNETSIDICHYLDTLKKKPGAIRNSLALKSIPELKTIFDIYFTSEPKQFIELIEKYKTLELKEMIMQIRNNVLLDCEPGCNAAIETVTENQLDMYNNLLIGRRH